MKKLIIISLLLFVGLNGFGQKLKPITQLTSELQNEYDLIEYIFLSLKQYNEKHEQEQERIKLSPSAEFRNRNYELDTCYMKQMNQIKANLVLIDSVQALIKLQNLTTTFISDTVYYASIIEVPITLKINNVLDCKPTKLKATMKCLIIKKVKKAYNYKANTHYRLMKK